MSLSPIAFFGLLDETNPVGTDSRTISDDQHRNILASMKQQAPNWTAAVTATHGDVNLLSGYVAAGRKPLSGAGGVTVMFFYNDTVPTGWTVNQVNTDPLYLAIAPVQPAVPGVYGVDPCALTSMGVTVQNVTVDLPASVANTTLDLTQVPAELITSTGPTAVGTGAAGFISGNTGGGQPHNHTLGGTAAQTPGSGTGSSTGFDPKRAIGILGLLDA